jgi:lambda family phage portal protein
MNPIDLFARVISPGWALSRARNRGALAAFEAAKPGRSRKDRPDNSGANTVIETGAVNVRGYARNLDQNHDIAVGILNTLVLNTVGPHGLKVEPMPRNRDGSINFEFAKSLLRLWERWGEAPEVTGQHDWAKSQKIGARSMFRDGEYLNQLHLGRVPGLEHGSVVPMSLEFFEADQLPMDLSDSSKRIVQGIQLDDWNRPQNYYILKEHPGDSNKIVWSTDATPVPASRIIHPKHVTRFGQLRGVSILASVIRRLESVKDMEESELMAARIAAALSAVITRGSPEHYEAPKGEAKDRSFRMQPGMVFDRMEPGEGVEVIKSDRPNNAVVEFRGGMLKAAASGVSANYSSIARDYAGSYSSQRQELVEGWTAYTSMQVDFAALQVRPVWRPFVDMCILSGLVRVPNDLDRTSLYDAAYWGPVMPWIDPDKESKGKERMVRAGFESPQKVIRQRGDDPNDTMDQTKVFNDRAGELGLVYTSNPAHDKGAESSQTGSEEDEQENEEGE